MTLPRAAQTSLKPTRKTPRFAQKTCTGKVACRANTGPGSGDNEKLVVEVRVPGFSARWEADAEQVKRLVGLAGECILESQAGNGEVSDRRRE